ncbi:hypothetical protein Tco_0642952 [Tanacetum coccineum]
MISLDGGEFTDPKVVRKITSILKTMFNGSWTTWKEVDKSGRELFKWEGLSDVLVHDAWEEEALSRYHVKGQSRVSEIGKGGQYDKKGGVFGWGSMSDPQYTMTGTPSTTRCTGAPSGSKDVQNYLDSVRRELKDELKEEMKVDLKEEMKDNLKEELKADLKEEMKNDLKEEMPEEIKEEMRKELTEEMRAKIQDMLVDYGIKSRVTRQTKTKQGNASSCTS